MGSLALLCHGVTLMANKAPGKLTSINIHRFAPFLPEAVAQTIDGHVRDDDDVATLITAHAGHALVTSLVTFGQSEHSRHQPLQRPAK